MGSYSVVIRGKCDYAYTYSVEADTVEEAVEEAGIDDTDLVDTELDNHSAESIEVYDEDGKRVLDKKLPRQRYIQY